MYRAEDTTLKREVAIKVLPERFTQDTERLARFEREAQLLASLNHPNIAAIHSFEHSDEVHFLAMELVEGETLAQRVAKGPLPVEEALEVSRQIAEGLEAAHESGVIHRDLKPANVNLTPEGKVKILDFGLAKALEGEIPVADISHSPTRTGEMTSAGVILGTAAYMSPEQARGKPVDKRTDIWAFGCVLFEALTGRQEFGGETISDCIAKVLQKEPDWEALPEKTPWRIQDLLRRCLQKDPYDRLRHIGDAGIEVREALSEPFGATPLGVEAPLPRSSWRQGLPWALVGITIIVALTLVLIDSGKTSERMGSVRFSIPPPEAASLVHRPSISPDGKRIVFEGHGEGEELGEFTLWVREIDSETAKRLDGTEGHESHFWSPDSRYIGFFAQGKLKKIDVSGGPAISLSDASRGFGGTWNRGGTIIVAPSGVGPLYRLPAAGGEPMPLTALDESLQQTSHLRPCFLPDGRHFLYTALSKLPEETAIYLGSLDSDRGKLLLRDSSIGVYAPPGYLLFVREGTLFAQPFDPVQLKVSGEPLPVAEQVSGSDFSVSESGILVYSNTGFGPGTARLVWLDRSGTPVATVADPGGYGQVVLSPDQQRVAVSMYRSHSPPDIWLLELQSNILSRFTFDPSADRSPIWSPDGRRLAFTSNRSGPPGLFHKAVGGSEVEVLLESGNRGFMKVWSKDGYILYLGGGANVLRLGNGEESEPRRLFEDPFRRDAFRLSPDQKWIAYHSNESGRFEVYVATFPDFSRKKQISREGGTQPQWRGDGKELFFLQLDRRLMSVDLDTDSSVGTRIPKALFQTRAGLGGLGQNYQYCVTSDGQRFLFIEPVEEEYVEPIHVVLNWFEELKRLAPTDN